MFIAVGLFIAVEFYFSLKVSAVRVSQMLRTMPLLVFTTVAALWLSGIYKSLLRYAGADTFFQAVVATLAGTGITYTVSLLISLLSGIYHEPNHPQLFLMPRPVYFIQWVVSLALIGDSRFLVRYKSTGAVRHSGEKSKRILVIGAGYAGATVIRDIQNGRYGNAVAVGILDDDISKQSSSIARVPVIGGTDEIEEKVEENKVDEIIIAIATPKGDLTDLLNRC